MASLRVEELLKRKTRLAERRAAAVALAASGGPGDQLARKELEEVLRLAEAAREEARRAYRLEQGVLRLRLRRGASREDTRGGSGG